MENREKATKGTGDPKAAEADRKPKGVRKIARPGGEGADEHGVTPEMLAMAEALAHPEGDPYLNARNMGFYCEQCG